LGIAEVKLFTDQMPFLKPNQQYQMTEQSATERQSIIICRQIEIQLC